MSQAIQHILLEQSICELLSDTQPFPIVCFKHSDSIGFVLEQLASENLISALVLKGNATPDVASGDSNRLYSKVEIKDILGFVDLNIILQSLLRGAFESNIVHYDAESLEAIAAKFYKKNVGVLLMDVGSTFHGSISNDWALKGNRTASIYSVVRECFLFAKPGARMKPPKSPAKCIHHVAIYSVSESEAANPSPTPSAAAADANLCGILSQIDIVRFLHNHEQQGGRSGKSVFHKTVKDLGLVAFSSADIPPSPSTTSSENSELLGKSANGPRMTLVPQGTTALEAFRRMCMQRDCGVGVLGADGTLKYHLSPTDLRGLCPGHFHTLLMPADEFLAKRPLLVKQSVPHAESSPIPLVAVETAGGRRGAAAAPPAKRRRATCTAAIKGVLTCQATSSLAEVLSIMSTHSVHQVYVVDPDSKPLCSITVVDALRVVLDSVAGVTGRGARLAPASSLPPVDTPCVPTASAVRGSRLESATSGQSERAASVCTSLQSEPQAVNSRLGSSTLGDR